MTLRSNKLTAAATACLAIATLPACMSPANAQYAGSSQRSYQEAPQLDVNGYWCFEDRSQRNYISDAGGAITVTPSKGRSATYVQVGDYLYRDMDGPGTYEFVRHDTVVWRSNNGSRKMIVLYRC